MKILGIESSCDETAASVIDESGLVLSDVVSSQIDEHRPYGGVVPELASRAHLSAIGYVIEQALAPLPQGLRDVDAIAVTNGPGLVGALLVGVQTAKALAYSTAKPLVGVDHLTAHILAVFLRRNNGAPSPPQPAYPFIALLVSGGHTALYRVDSPHDIALISQTRDDAAGECFDKAAKLLGLGYPGGPLVDKLAAQGDRKAFELPRPLRAKQNLDFSFSGLKTAVAMHVRAHGAPAGPQLADFCASFQDVVVDSLVRKSMLACELQGVPRLVLAGGVAANRGLRERAAAVGAKRGVEVFVPPVSSCTDNAAMIAYAGLQRFLRGERDGYDLGVYSRGVGVKRGAVR